MIVFVEEFEGFPYFLNDKNSKNDYSGSMISLKYKEQITRNGRKENDYRFFQIYGTLTELDRFFLLHRERGSHNSVIGRIVVNEFLESSVPENFKSRLVHNKPWNESIKYKLLQDYKTTSFLTFNGERIIRFFYYDPTGDEKDIIIENTDPASYNKTTSTIQSVESVNVQNESKTVPENTFSKTNVSSTLNDKAAPGLNVESNLGQTNYNNTNHQTKSHTSINVLFVIGLLAIVFFAFMFKNIAIFIIGAAIVGFISYLIGGIVQGPTKSTSLRSTVITIVIGIIAIIAISYAFGGCGVSDSEWRRP